MESLVKFRVAVVGGGPAGLMASEVLALGGAAVTVFDRMPAVGRKFLLAGRGGLNLTHSEPLDHLLQRYGKAEPHLRSAIERFSPDALRDWSAQLGQKTFVGSSGRVFPNAMKASPLLRTWLRRLDAIGVSFRTRHRWVGWDEARRLMFETLRGAVTIDADATVLALGGASWPRLGSDGAWTATLEQNDIVVSPLLPANCGVTVEWTDKFRERFEGQPLKRVALSIDGRSSRGEVVITSTGVQGGALYALSKILRKAIGRNGRAILTIDLRPDEDIAGLEQRLRAPRGKQSLSNFLRKAIHLPPVAIALLHETAAANRPLSGCTPAELAARVKSVPVKISGIEPIARAISTAGGISFDALDENLMLRQRPGTFAAGEMLDWEAPTGGYLLQGAFATGAAAGQGVLRWFDGKTR